MTSRAPAVAGMFYPSDPQELKQQVLSLLAQAKASADPSQESHLLRALIVPHAGYIYSGLSAAFAYNLLNQDYKRVILLGPGHRVAVDGMAVPDVSSFASPLGEVPLDEDEIDELVRENLVISSNRAHEQEHCLEVQLPFLQTSIESFKLIPIVVGQCRIESIAQLLSRYINNADDLIVISTDLSHFLEYSQAQQQDQNTRDKIMAYEYERFGTNDACGRIPMAGMLQLAKDSGLSIKQLDMRNSGDTAGDKQSVVGYGAWGLYA